MRRLFKAPAGPRAAYSEVAQAENGVELSAYSTNTEPEAQVPSRRSSMQDMAGSSVEKPYDEADDLEPSVDDDEPTEEERRTLRKVPDTLPWSAFLVAAVELCERFTYYGLSGPFQNYIANKYHDPSGLPGAIGLKQSGATALTNFFMFWCYLTPIIGAVVADQYLGKYLTIVYFSIIYAIGVLILFVTSLPASIEHGFALIGLVIAMIVIGLGTGGIKSNVSPLIAEQYTETKQRVRVLKTGERVIVDPAVTIQRIYMMFYLCINLGSLSPIITTQLEKYVGFWSAYLLPFVIFVFGFVVLVTGRKRYVVRPPKGSIIVHCMKALVIGIANNGNLAAAKPSYQQLHGRRFKTPWNDLFIDELSRALVACRVFLFYPIYWLVFNQMMNNFVSQAGQMQLHGIPNDFMQNIDPLSVVIFIPIMDRLVYPLLRRMGFEFKPITRIFFGFILGSIGMAYAAFVQHVIYSSGPCYQFPLNCDAAKNPDGSFSPNNVNIAVQAPAYLFIGVSEIFASVTGLEYAFTKAPASMKSFIMSLFLLTSAVGSILGAALAPSAKDPNLTWLYIGLATACFVAGIIFWVLFSRYNKTEDQMNELEKFVEKPKPVGRVNASVRGSHRHESDEEDGEDAVPLNDGGPSNQYAQSHAV